MIKDAAWCWFAGPRVASHQGLHRRLFAGWVTREGDVVVAHWDLDTGAQAQSVLRARLDANDHASPALAVAPDGRLAVFYSAHNGPAMWMRASLAPEDASAFGPELAVGGAGAGEMGCTYPSPAWLHDEDDRLHLFWRGGDWGIAHASSEDGGASWSPPATVIATPGHRPYARVNADGRSRIDLVLNEGHPRDVDNGVWHAFYEAGALHHSDGRLIATLDEVRAGEPLAPSDLTAVHAFEAEQGPAWVWDLARDDTGQPVASFATFRSAPDGSAYGDHRYHLARWLSDRWQVDEITAAGSAFPLDPGIELQYSGGAVIDQHDPSRLYLSREVDGQFELERWKHDGSTPLTWRRAAITTHSPVANVRPCTPAGPVLEGAPEVLWMRGDYEHYEGRFTTGIEAWSPAPGTRRRLAGRWLPWRSAKRRYHRRSSPRSSAG